MHQSQISQPTQSAKAGLRVIAHPVTRWLALGVAIGGLIYHALIFDFLNDDAFISFRYADNLVEHGELVFNPGTGERVEGYTNFLWTILMALVLWCGEDPAVWSRILGVACAAGTLCVITAFISRTRGRRQLSDVLGAILWPLHLRMHVGRWVG